MSTPVHSRVCFSTLFSAIGKTSGDNLRQIIVLRFPEWGVLSTAVIPRPRLSQRRYPDNA